MERTAKLVNAICLFARHFYQCDIRRRQRRRRRQPNEWPGVRNAVWETDNQKQFREQYSMSSFAILLIAC